MIPALFRAGATFDMRLWLAVTTRERDGRISHVIPTVCSVHARLTFPSAIICHLIYLPLDLELVNLKAPFNILLNECPERTHQSIQSGVM